MEYRAPRRKILSQSEHFLALDNVSIQINEGESLGVVGSSGAGKTTFAKVISGQVRQTVGTVRFRGHELELADKESFRKFRMDIQYVFQNPKSSFDPRIRRDRLQT